MPSRRSLPRIRVDLLDGSSRNLSPSSTLDIRDILCQFKPSPKLLAEDLVFDNVDNALYLEDGSLSDVPPFPTGHRPPLFTLNSHRTRLPFPIRPEAFELGDLCWDEEDVYPLLTAPTVPRMKLMIKEQLYVQKWVDTLTPENPPKHIPWTCERPAMERKWIAEGSIFPAAVVESSNEQRRVIKGRSRATDINRLLVLHDEAPCSGDPHAFSASSPSIHPSTESHMPGSQIIVKSADVDPGIHHGEPKIPQTPHRIVRTSPAPPTPLPSSTPTRTTLNMSHAPLAARRGKLLSGLKLKGSVIEQLEYPDIPTAFRGSPSVWPTRFDTFPVSFFTDHQRMLLDLKSKSAALVNEALTYIQESSHPQTEMTCTSLSVDEWTFAQGLATFDSDLPGLTDSRIPSQIVANTSIFLPDDFSTPAKGPGFTARLGSTFRPHSMAALQTPVKRSSGPPGDPLPPRPALISPSTPPSVRGILKKAKNVRFEDAIIKESQTNTPSAPTSERPCTPTPNAPRPSSDLTVAKKIPASRRHIQDKKSTPKSRLPPKRTTKANGKFESMHPNVVKAPENLERRRTLCAKENTSPAADPQAHAKPKGMSIAEADLRTPGIEGTAKSRLSTPLRNIFRFR